MKLFMKKIFVLFCAFLCATLNLLAQVGRPDLTFNPADDGFHIENRIDALARQTDGKLIVGGYLFSARNTLARINADGTLDGSFNPGAGPDESVTAIALQTDGKILIGGTFTTYNGTARNRIARLHADGSLDAGFAIGTGFSTFGNTVNDIVLQPDGKILVAGQFTNYNGSAVGAIVRLNTDGTMDNTFSSNGATAAGGAFIFDLDLQPDGKVLICGNFTAYGGTARGRIARLNANGTLDATFNPGTGAANTVFALARQPDGKVIAGGSFTTFNGASANRLIRLNANGSADGSFNAGTGPNSTVLELQLRPDGKLYAAGHFVTYGGVSRGRIALVNSNGTLDATYNPGTGLNAQVSSFLLLPDSRLLVGGQFDQYNGRAVEPLIRLETTASLDATFSTARVWNDQVAALAVQADGKVVTGGYFTLYGAQPVGGIVRTLADGTLDASFNTGGSGFTLNLGSGERINRIHMQADGKILVTGHFTSYNGITSNRLVRLHTDGSHDASFATGSGLNQQAQSSALQPDGKLLLSGNFSQYNGAPVSRLVRVNTDGTLDAGFAPVLNGPALSILPDPSGKIYIGGLFTQVNGSPVNHVARLNADGSLDATFNTGSGPNDAVYSMALQSTGKLVICGQFASVNGVARTRLARLNTDGSVDATFTATLDVYASALLTDAGDKTIVGGSFTTVNGAGQRYLVRLNADGSTDATFNAVGSGPDNAVLALAADPAGRLMIAGQFHPYNGIGRSHTLRLLSTSVSTGTVSGSPFCPGAPVSVPFTITGSFNAGNVFTAQLSDASGSFAAPTVIGTLSGSTGGTINATIPAATTAGTGYRIRVVASDPATTGTDNGSNLTVVALPFAAIAYAGSPYCATGTATPTITGVSGGTFSGTPAGLSINAATGAIDVATSTSGTYTVTYTVTNCGTVTATASVTIVNPTVNTITNQNVCAGNTVGPISFNGANSFSWTNSNPAVGLAANGTGNIAAFTATNPTATPITSTVTVTPRNAGTFAYGTNFGGNTVTVVNVNTGVTVANITVGSSPYGVAVTPDQQRVYVANANSDNVSVISTATNTVIATIPVGDEPYGLAVSPDGSKVYVANIGSDNVSVISTATNAVTTTIAVGDQPASVAISPNGQRVYVANANSGTVTVINGVTNAFVATLAAANRPLYVLVSPDNARLYVARYQSSLLSVFNTATNTLQASINVGTGALSLDLSADGSRLYAAMSTTNRIAVVNTATNAVSYVAVGSSPHGVQRSADGSKVYVALNGTNGYAIVNTAGNTVEGTFASGGSGSLVAIGRFLATTTSSCNGTPMSFTITVSPAVSPAFQYPSNGYCATGTATPTITGVTGGTFSGTAGLVINAATGLVDLAASSAGTHTVTYSVNGSCGPVSATAVLNITAIPDVNAPTNQSLCAGTASAPVSFSGGAAGTVYAWTNSNTAIGLGASGTGNIGSFVSTNAGAAPISATITVTPQNSNAGFAYLPGRDNNTISVINLATGVQSASITGFSQPYGAVINPARTLVYVSNGAANNISVVNTATNSITASIPIGAATMGLALSPDGSRLYAARGDNQVAVVNTATNTVIATITVGNAPYGLTLSADGTRLYVCNYQSNSVSVINTSTNTVAATIAVGTEPWNSALSPDGSRLYVANAWSSSISVINTATNTVINTITGVVSPNAIVVSADGSKLFVMQPGTGLGIYSAGSGAPLDVISLAIGSAGLCLSANGTRLYVPRYSQGELLEYDAATHALLRTIPTTASGIYGFGNWMYNTVCSGTPKTFTITVHPQPAATISYSGSPYCASGTATPVRTGTAGGVFSSTTGLSINAATGVIDLAASSAGTYTVTYTLPAAAGCAAFSTTATVTVQAGETMNQPADQTFCAGTLTTAVAFSGASAGATYSWTNSNTSIGLAASGTGNIPAFTATNATGSPVTATVTVTPQLANRFAFIANNTTNNVSVVDIATNTIVSTISVGNGPVGVAVHPNGSRVYVANSASSTVSVINTTSFTVTATIALAAGSNPYGIAVSPDGSKVYTANNGGSSLSEISTATNTVTRTNLVGAGPVGIIVSPDGSRLYVTRPNGASVTTVDAATLAVTANATVGSGPNGLAITPNGGKVFIANSISNFVSILNTATNTVTNVPVTGVTYGAAMSPDGTRAYVTNWTNGAVHVFNTATNAIVAQINLGGRPYGVSVSPDGARLYVTNTFGHSMFEVNLANNSLLTTLPLVAGGNPATIGNFISNPVVCAPTPRIFTITVNPSNSASISYPGSPFCGTTTATPTLTGAAGGSYSSTAGLNLNAATGVIDLVNSLPGTYTVSYMLPAAGGCAAVNATTGITVLANPEADQPPNVTVCAGSAVPAISFSGTAAVYTWTNSNPAVGLAASGTGNLPGFTASATPQTATITVTPVSGSPSAFAYVPNSGSNNISVMNTATNAVVATVPVGTYPFTVSALPNGSRVYVVNKNSNNVSVINTATNAVIATITVGFNPMGSAVSPDGSRLYVINNGDNTISVINTATNTVSGLISGFSSPYHCRLSPDGSKLYVTNSGNSTLATVSTATNAITATLSLGSSSPLGMALSADGSRLYIANNGSHNISVVNTVTNSVVQTIAVGSNPVSPTLSPDGSRLYVPNPGSSNLSIINTATNTLIANIGGFGGQPYAASVSPDGSRLYLTIISAGTVAVINTSNNLAIASIPVGASPLGMGGFLVSTGSACTGTPRSFTITVEPAPAASISYSGSPFCSAGTATPAITGSTGGTFSSTAGLSMDATTGVINLVASTPGTYTITYTVPASGGCPPVTATTSVTVQGAAQIVQPANLSYCGGSPAGPIVFSGANGSGFNWTNDNPAIGLAASGTGNIPAFTTAAAATQLTATITVSMNAQAGYCPATPRTFTITVSPAPGADFGYSSGTFCAIGTAAPIPQSGHTAGGTYSAGAGMSIHATTGVIDLANTVPGLYTVLYQVPASGSCAAVQGSTTIRVNAPASATISYGGAPICGSAASVAVVRTGTAGGTYTAPAGLSIDAASGTINPAASTPGTYTVTYAIAAGGQCPAFSTTAIVNIAAAPAASISYAGSPYCNGGTASVTQTGTPGGSYSSSAGLVMNPATGAINLAASTPGSYTVTYSVPTSGGCAAFSATAPVTISAAPSATISYGPGSFCSNAGSIAVTRSGTAGGTYSATAGLALDATTGAIDAGASAPGTYTVTYTVSAAGACPGFSATAGISISPAPAASITYNGSPYCAGGGSATVTRTGWATGAYSAVPAGLALDAATGAVDLAASTPGTYTVSYTTTGNGPCAAFAATTTITVTTAPLATISYGASAFCSSAGTVAVTRTGSGGGTYSAAPAGLSIDAASGAVDAASSTPGIYTVTYTVAGAGGCTAFTTTTSIRVDAAPSATITYAGTPYCNTAGTVLPVFSGTGGGIWSASPAGLSIDAATGAINTNTSSAGAYTVTYSLPASSGCAAFVVSASMALGAAPSATIAYNGSPYCNSGTASPVRTGTAGGSYAAGAGLSIHTTTGVIDLAASVPGTYTVTYRIGAANGCAAFNTTAIVVVTEAPAATITYGGSPYCSNAGPALPTLSGSTGGSFSSTAALSINSATGAIDLAASAPGAYTVTYTVAASGGCMAFSTSAAVAISAAPTATIAYSGSPFCNSGTGTVTINGSSGGNFTAPAGLAINPVSGAINLGASLPGNYTVTYTLTPPGCAPVSATTGVTVLAASAASISYAAPAFCANSGLQPVTQTGNSGGTYTALPAGLSIDPANGTINPVASAPGTYTVTYSLAANGPCPAFSTTASVIITAAPSAAISYAGTPYCSGSGAASVTRTGTAGGTFSSTAGLVIDPASGAINLSASTAGTYTVTYSVAAAGGCAPFSTTATVSVGRTPTATIAYPGTPYCASDGTATPVVSGATGGAFSGSVGLVIDPVTGTVNLASSATGIHTVTYVVNGTGTCPALTTTTTLTINPAPAAAINYGAAAFCSSAGVLTPVLTGTAAGSYSAVPAGLAINTATGAIDAGASNAGNYTVTYTIAAANGCSVFTTSTAMQITSLPAAGISYATPLCNNGPTIGVTRTGTAGGTYSATPAGLALDATTGAINGSASAPGTYTVTYTIAAAGGCAAVSATTQATVNTAPAATLSYGAALCTSGGIVLPTMTGATGGAFSASPAGLAIDLASGAINGAASTAGTYTVTYSIAAVTGCAPVSATTTVNVNAGPAATINYAGTPFCGAGGPVTVTRTGTAGGSYSATAGLVVDAVTGTINLSASAPGLHTITYTVAPANGCVLFSTTTQVVIRNPAVNPVANATYCAGDASAAVTFTGTGTTYSWSNTNPGIGLAVSGTGNIPSFTTVNATGVAQVATITVTPDDNGCAGTPRSFAITVNPMPAATLTASSGTVLCPGTPLYLLAAGGSTYAWFRDGNSIPANGSLIDAQTPGTYNVRVTTAAGCSAMAPNAITVTQIPAPVPAFTVNGTCFGNATQFTNNTNSAGNAVVNYQWNFGDGTTSAQISPAHSFSRTGFFRVTLRAWVPGCEAASGTASEQVRIEHSLEGLRLPAVNATANVPVQLRARSFPGAVYSWSPAAPLSAPSNAAPVARLTSPTEFLVRMRLPSGCEATDTLLVRVFSKNDLLVPEAFTPNGDGKNDVLRVIPVGIREFRYFRVFSRTGELVFETRDPARPWDGLYKGKATTTATYVWIAEGIDLDGQHVVRKGTVTLIR